MPPNRQKSFLLSSIELLFLVDLRCFTEVRREAAHEKQMPCVARWGDCPAAASRARGSGVHWSEAETLGGGSGWSRRRVWPGGAGEAYPLYMYVRPSYGHLRVPAGGF